MQAINDGREEGPHPELAGELASSFADHSGGTPGLELPVVTHRLANGLTLLVLPREGAPIATFYTQFNIGSVHERAGITGVSHLLEHMLKKGTSRVGTRDWAQERAYFPQIDAVAADLHGELRSPSGPDAGALTEHEARLRAIEDEARQYIVAEEYDLILKRNGARHRNATTSTDRTNFFVSLPVERAEVWFALEADRLKDLVFRDFYRERDVVMEERRRNYETQPWGLLREELFSTAFTRHPYGIPTIGHMAELKVMERGVVESHFRRYYGACNCVAVVVGHVEPERMIELAERYLGQVPRGEPIPPVETKEPAQTAERRAYLTFDAEPHMMVAWKVPPADHEDGPALAMLSSLLTDGRSSRVYRSAVIDERVATDIACSMGPGQMHDRLFVFSSVPRRPHTTGEVEATIYREIQRLKDELVTEEELQRVLNRREAHEIRRLQSNLGLAWQIGMSQGLFGDWRWTFQYGTRMGRVTAEDLRRVTRRYFVDHARTVAILDRGEGSPPRS